MKDIINVEGNIINENLLHEILQVKTNWIMEYQIVKKACNVVEIKDLRFLCNTTNIKRDRHTIFIKDKHYDVDDKRCNFYYDALRNNKFVYPYMQRVWCKDLELTSLKYQHTWQQIYKLKIKKMPIKKLAEFNYKLLNATLPCGVILCKWKKNIDANCTVCTKPETLKHMLFECKMVCEIWKTLGLFVNVNIMWKHLVVGYFLCTNNRTENINFITSFISYSIFKINNRCKWNEVDYGTQNISQYVISDLILLAKTIKYCKTHIVNEEFVNNLIIFLKNIFC